MNHPCLHLVLLLLVAACRVLPPRRLLITVVVAFPTVAEVGFPLPLHVDLFAHDDSSPATASAVLRVHTRGTLSFVVLGGGSKLSRNNSSGYLLTSSAETLLGMVMSTASWQLRDLSSTISLV